MGTALNLKTKGYNHQDSRRRFKRSGRKLTLDKELTIIPLGSTNNDDVMNEIARANPNTKKRAKISQQNSKL